MAEKMAVYGLQYQRSRLAGKINHIKMQNHRYAEQMEELRSRIAANEEQLAILAKHIETLGSTAEAAFATRLPPPVPRQTRPKHHLTSWGGITRESLCCLREAGGNPLTTREIAEYIERKFELNLTLKQSTQLVESIRTTMKRLNGKSVRRIAAAPLPGTFSTWVLADIAE